MTSPWNDRQSLTELSHMAAVYRKLGQIDRAENLYHVIIDDLEKTGHGDQRLAVALYSLAETLSDQQRFGEALPLYKRAVGVWEKEHHVESLGLLWYSEALAKLQEISAQHTEEIHSDLNSNIA